MTPFEPAYFPPSWMDKYTLPGTTVVMNNRYQVCLRKAAIVDGKPITSLSIKRRDKKPIRSWRDLLWIKNQLCGEECEAVEIFPPMSKLLDTSNQYWLWVFPEGVSLGLGLGNDTAVVCDGDGSTAPGRNRQQPLPEWYPPPVVLPEEA